MSAPVREPGDSGPLNDVRVTDGPLNYAPKKARRSEQDQNLNGASGKVDVAPPRRMPEPPEPPWKRKTQREAFAGDVAIADMRTQLALAPDRIPEPPLPASTVPAFAWVGRFIGVIVVVAASVIGYWWGSAPPTTPSPQQFVLASDQAQPAANFKASNLDSKPPAVRSATIGLAPGAATDHARSATNGATSADAAQRSLPAMEPRIVAAPAAAPPEQAASAPPPSQFNGQNSRDPASARAASRQLTINAVRLRQADEPARLTISAADAGANVVVVIGGLAPGSALSAGTPAGPNTWRLSADDFNDAAVTPPRGFVGVMDLALELRLADNTVVDRQGLQLEWSAKNVLAPAKPQPRRLEAAEIALMMKNGSAFMANGNIGAARMMFQPAAEAGEPVAAFALAETYDPLVLRKLGAKGGITSDIALALSWYEKAKNLGSTVAPERLERLARLPE